MIRTAIWFFYFALSLIFSIPALIKVRKAEAAGDTLTVRQRTFAKAGDWSRELIAIAGGKIQVNGRENIPENESFLVVSNHQSNFDIPILLGYFGHPLAFIAKIETKKMPIVRDWMTYIRCIFMDRSDFRKSVAAINQGAEGLKEGYNYVIFPEGTRSKDGSLGDFKPGSLKMASKAGVKILPLTITGSIDMMPKGRTRITPASVTVTIHPPVESGGNQSELLNHVVETIASAL